MKQAKILIADDERAIAAGLSAILEDEGYSVDVAGDGQSALDRLTSDSYGVVLADLKMPKMDGLALLQEMQAREIASECIIITGQGTVDSAIQAMRHGAYDYIEKPLNAEKLTRLKALIPKAIDKFNVKQTNLALTTRLEQLTHYGELTGQSEEMRDVYRMIEAVAPSTATVLILGESGTGKELVARALHAKSDRAKGPFIALNCAALPKDILENELFGHEKGAFTGSTNEKPGAFEMAHGGTIFLDEVAEMAPDIQVKLLRALESRTVRRLGGKKEIAVDIRVLSATNKDLQKAIADGELREDLYYRLAVVDIFLPPLRERVGDIKLLASEFLARYARENRKEITGFDEGAWEWILSYDWPGNVRELKNAVERAVIMARGKAIGAEDIMPRHLRTSGQVPAVVTLPVGSTLADARRKLVLSAVANADGNLERAAKVSRLSVAEVRAELAALLDGGVRAVNGPRSGDGEEAASGGTAVASAKSKSVAAKAQKSKPKGRR
ncbi:MAG TPA: sigma-54 dependent transcriptional regulator [Gemmatimonadaceae bacterium]|nr:sigma-54 dependent transcriptional regulator [Gemmatimonadaceae bacterium]